MRLSILTVALASAATTVLAAEELKIDVTHAVECERKTKNGDNVEMHYKGTLAKDGSKFDASYDRGTPFKFQLGQGRVIKGWDQGLLDMCIGEKRTLTIPPELGYGSRGMGPIPAGSTLIFETELIGIAGVPKPASTASESTLDDAGSAADKVAGGLKEKIAEKIADAAGTVKTILADTDGDGQEHNEL